MLHRAALRVFGALPRWAKSRIVRALYPTFTGGAVACLTNPAGQVLLVTHSYSAGWGLPGGLMNRHEDLAATASRELREELGLEVELAGPAIAVKTPGRSHINVLFRAELDEAAASSVEGRSPEITGAEFFTLGDLPDLAEFTDLFLEALGLEVPR
jgi:ADP-ribose pyrophosphatase YjhB (NUDIX family)